MFTNPKLRSGQLFFSLITSAPFQWFTVQLIRKTSINQYPSTMPPHPTPPGIRSLYRNPPRSLRGPTCGSLKRVMQNLSPPITSQVLKRSPPPTPPALLDLKCRTITASMRQLMLIFMGGLELETGLWVCFSIAEMHRSNIWFKQQKVTHVGLYENLAHWCYEPFCIKTFQREMSEDGLTIVMGDATFITLAKTRNVRVLNLIKFKDYWRGGTRGKPSLTFTLFLAGFWPFSAGSNSCILHFHSRPLQDVCTVLLNWHQIDSPVAWAILIPGGGPRRCSLSRLTPRRLRAPLPPPRWAAGSSFPAHRAVN